MLELFETDWRDLWVGVEANDPVGAIFTKPEIVDLILDLCGYEVTGRRLAELPLLEPSCGDGAFLVAIIRRLITSEREHIGTIDWRNHALANAIRATDISLSSVSTARSLSVAILREFGCPIREARRLSTEWIIQTDFLLEEWPNRFEFVVGNPPYVRIEDLPRRVLQRYRELYRTTSDRADLYIAFFERGLELLTETGTLAFICANRFTKNKYGELLRTLLSNRYHTRHYLNLEHTQPFLAEVSAYPAIIVVDRDKGKSTTAATLPDIEPVTIEAVRHEILCALAPTRIVSHFKSWYPKGEPWITTSDIEHAILDELNATFPTLENSAPATKVGIGVATGADDVFVLGSIRSDIETSRQIPLLMAADVKNDSLKWSGHFLLNPFADADDGSLISSDTHPGAAAYLAEHREQLRKRHVAKNRPDTWFRTIDRIWPTLTSRPKLMIPDIQSSTTIGFDEGEYYPHHNIYWISSETWPLLALKTILRSSTVYQQVRAYSVQMRGGSVRFQAQTLRRIRIPELGKLSDAVLVRLCDAATVADQSLIDELAREAYGI